MACPRQAATGQNGRKLRLTATDSRGNFTRFPKQPGYYTTGNSKNQSKTYIPKNAISPSPGVYSIPQVSASFLTKIQ